MNEPSSFSTPSRVQRWNGGARPVSRRARQLPRLASGRPFPGPVVLGKTIKERDSRKRVGRSRNLFCAIDTDSRRPAQLARDSTVRPYSCPELDAATGAACSPAKRDGSLERR
jgi:hypothetical protein